ncbi:MAG: AraC family transcriptional regulator [Kiritimatiellia bacterium]
MPSNIKFISKQSYILNQPSKGRPWVLRVAQEHWNREFHHVRRGHDSSFIAYIQEGCLAIETETSRLEARPGHIVYLAREPCQYGFSVIAEKGLRLLICVVRFTPGSNVVTEFLGQSSRIFAPADAGQVESLFMAMLTAAGKGYPAASDIVAGLLPPTLQTIRLEHEHASATGDPGRMLFTGCREYIIHNYIKIRSVADVARQFGTTHARLCRLFQRHADCPPHRFLLRRKMTHALHELQQRNRSIGEVGYELGFADPYSFSKAFKRIMGFSPSRSKSDPKDAQ